MITVRPLTGHDEFADAVHLQRMIWGWDDLDLLPVRFFVVASDIGGQVLGAFDDKFLCGFLLAIPALKADGTVYLHSHMLGVLPEYRNSGAGLALKLAQKDEALARGIDLVEWTFDPLELKNAYFNIQKLGAIARRYLPNHYGVTTSHLQAGLPTDRLVAEWHLDRTKEPKPVSARIAVPADIERIKRTDPEGAIEIQRQICKRFRMHLSNELDGGLAVTGFERSTEAGTYLLSPWPSK
jgi:predicted GNAT superfamily acetyltransferase